MVGLIADGGHHVEENCEVSLLDLHSIDLDVIESGALAALLDRCSDGVHLFLLHSSSEESWDLERKLSIDFRLGQKDVIVLPVEITAEVIVEGIQLSRGHLVERSGNAVGGEEGVDVIATAGRHKYIWIASLVASWDSTFSGWQSKDWACVDDAIRLWWGAVVAVRRVSLAVDASLALSVPVAGTSSSPSAAAVGVGS